MFTLPRLAVGTIQPGADPQVMVWALMEALRQGGIQVQGFHSRACFPRHPGAASVTGLSARHLDSWLMTPETCRQVFVRGAKSADLAVVEGRFASAVETDPAGGRLEPLCVWLDLPRVVVVDVSRIGECRWPQRPPQVDAVLLDRAVDDHHAAQLATEFETLWGAPVLGVLQTLPGTRSQLESMAAGERLPSELCQALGENFSRYWQPEKLLGLATRDGLSASCGGHCCCTAAQHDPLTVAIAYDEAFNCYFPDVLDVLELRGASVVDFSPLRDEHLPPQVDIVYFGCGHPERYASALSENHCMAAALRSHLCAGRRIYGEGGGAAYLCQHLETPEGNFKRMAGILPAVARLARHPVAPRPVERTLAHSTWLGDRGTQIRGYRNSLWHFEPVGPLAGLVADSGHHYDLAGGFNSVGSLLHLDFAAQPQCVDRFFWPEPPQGEPLTPWTTRSPST